MKKIISSIALLTSIFFSIHGFSQTCSQTLPAKRINANSGLEQAQDFLWSADGQIVAVGYTNSGATGEDGLLLKMNTAGVVAWAYTMGGTAQDRFHKIKQCSDGGYIILGNTVSFGGIESFLLAKTTSAGTISWSRTYDYFQGAKGYDVIQMSDGGFACVGFLNGPDKAGIMRTDANGLPLWGKVVNGSSNDYFLSLAEAANGDILAVGSGISYSVGLHDFMMIRFAGNGSVLWQKILGSPFNDGLYSVKRTADNGFIITGGTWDHSGGAYLATPLVKLDAQGKLLWAKQYGIEGKNHASFELELSPSGGYLVVLNEDFNGLRDYILETDAQGNLKWTYIFEHPLDINFTGLRTSPGGCMAVVGGIGNGPGASDLFLWGVGPSSCRKVPNVFVDNLDLVEIGASYDFTDWTNSKAVNLTVRGLSLLSSDVCPCIAPVLDLGPDVVVCPGNTVVLDASPDFNTYLWQDGSTNQTYSPSFSGLYWVEVTDTCGNIQRDTVQVTVDIPVDLQLSDTSLCSGNSITLNVPGFVIYNWTPATGLSCTTCPSMLVQPTVTTTYTLMAINANGCDILTGFTVEVLPPGPTLDLGPDVILCQDSTVIFDAGPGFASYLWQDGSSAQSYAATVTGVYWVEATDSCGIVQRDSVLLTVSLVADIKLADTSICANRSLSLTVPGFDTYTWAPAAGLSCTNCSNVTIQPTATTTYNLLASNADGCVLVDTFTVVVLPLPTATQTIEFCPGETVTIGGQNYTQPTTFTDTIPNGAACDLVKTYVLKYLSAPNSSITIDCIEDINIATLAGTGSVLVNYALPTFVTDCPCPGVKLTLKEGLPSGSLFPVAKTKVCYEARDSCGNVDSCCFFVIIREALPCDVKEIGCMRYELLRITQNAAKERTYRIRVVNKCPDPLIYTAFELPPGVTAVKPADNSIFTTPDNRPYLVRNPNASPFHSIRFKSTTDSISHGEADIFEYTLPPQSVPDYIHVTARVFPQQFFEAYLNTFNCPVQPGQKPEFGNRPAFDLRVFPNPTSGLLYADLSNWVGEKVALRILDATGKQLQLLNLMADSVPQEIQLSRDLPEGLYFLDMETGRGEKGAVRFVVLR